VTHTTRRVRVTQKQQQQLEAWVARPSAPAGVVRRARVILLSAAGVSGIDIAVQLDLSPESVSRIRRRFVDAGVGGLLDQPKAGRRDHAVPAETVERILQLALSPPPAGRSRWTTRLLAKAVGHTSGCVSDVLRAHGLKPHLVRTYKVSRDPAFAAKVTDVVGLYLHPPEHAVVLSVDEKTSIQALERSQPPLPLRTGRAVRHTHDYRRHGVLDLYAALEVATGKVTHRFSPTHTAADFLRFMTKVARAYPGQDLHVVLDNSSTHNRGGPCLARRPSTRALPLHADQRVVVEPDRRVLRHPREAVAVGHRLPVHPRRDGPSPRLPSGLEQEPVALLMDEAGASHHQVT
jgi:transposase